MKSEMVMKRELARLEKQFKTAMRLTKMDAGWQAFYEVRSARQALAWALDENAAAPTKCVLWPDAKRKQH